MTHRMFKFQMFWRKCLDWSTWFYLYIMKKKLASVDRVRLDEGVDELEALIGFNSLVHELKYITRMKNLRHLSVLTQFGYKVCMKWIYIWFWHALCIRISWLCYLIYWTVLPLIVTKTSLRDVFLYLNANYLM